MTKKILFSLVACLLVAAVQAGPTQGVTDAEVVFGSHTPLTGPAALWGVGSINAIRMRFDEVNDAGGIHGRKIRFIVEDNQYQVTRAIQAANKLLNRDKIFAMVAALGTPMNNAVMPQQLAKNVPSIFPYSGSRSMGQPPHKLKFTVLTTNYSQARAGIKYSVEEKGKKAVCIQYQDTDFGQEVYEGTVDQLNAMGMTLAAQTKHKPTDTNFSAAMTKLRKAGCDLVVLGTVIKDTVMVITTARKMGWDVDFLGTNAVYEQFVASHESGATEGLHGLTPYEAQYEDTAIPEVREWMKRFEAQYGKPPGNASVLGRMVADLVVMALEQAGPDLTVDSFVEAMENIKDYKAFGAEVSFAPDKHDGLEKSRLTVVEDGRWKTITGPLGY